MTIRLAMRLALLAAAGLAACSTTPPLRGRPEETVPVTASAITATARAGELARLERAVDPGSHLRRAWLLLEAGRPTDALTPLNLVLFGDTAAGGAAEAWARYLRAVAHAATGDRARAAADLGRARTLPLPADARDRLERLADFAPRPSHPRTAVLAAPQVLPRSAWNARRASRMTAMSRIRRITIHHSGTLAPGRGTGAVRAAIAGIQRVHQNTRDWADIGYHYLIDPAGRIWEGRSIHWQGAHAGDEHRNRGNVGICLLGMFVPGPGGQHPTTEQLASLEHLVAWLQQTHDLDNRAILTHRELKNDTECPGELLQQAVARLRAGELAAAL